MAAIIDDSRIVEMLTKAVWGLVAIYRFGSTATGHAVSESDLDIAILPASPMEPLERWDLQEKMAVSIHCPVDLVDLLGASSVMRMQVLQSGILLFDGDPVARAMFETMAYSSYARLNEERRQILDDVAKEGTIYGRRNE